MRMLWGKCCPAVPVSQMGWFGFGFNAFGQIREAAKCEGNERTGQNAEVKVIVPVKIACCDSDRQPKRESEHAAVNTGSRQVQIRASWSRRATLHIGGESPPVFYGNFICSCHRKTFEFNPYPQRLIQLR